MKKLYLTVLAAAVMCGCSNKASVRETTVEMPTYAYSDPDPIANPDNLFYPYYGFDGYTDTAENKEWKVVELENAYIKLSIFPEIGGKIWGAVEKSTGNEFIYHNHAVKFRHVAMRGPWTSGGIEPNFGIIGHAPTTSAPIDYAFRHNEDGSVSCFIGATDLITGTDWCVEVNLEKDKAYFTTKTHWDNANPLPQAYYHWMNAGYKAADDLSFYFPGNSYIGHAGDAHSWPVDDQNRRIDEYAKNNFGEYKSYHVMGGLSDFYGAYWNNSDFGSVHHSGYDDKLGMKIWIWGLSRQGMIWENLLTDRDGQYVELQSGRMFNQPATGSTYSPFKQFGFDAYATDTWTEYWYPVKQTKGIAKANQYGALNIARENDELTLYFSPVSPIDEPVTVTTADGTIVYEGRISSQPMKTWDKTIPLDDPSAPVTVTIGDRMLVYSEIKDEEFISRPMATPEAFDWNSTYGLWLHGRQWMNQRYFANAEKYLALCLEKDSLYAPALNDMAELEYRKGNYEKAISLTRTSLSINTYDPAANMIYGLSHAALGHRTDAKDGFYVASYSPAFRSAAYTELAKEYIRENNWAQTAKYAQKAIDAGSDNITAQHALAIAYRKTGQTDKAVGIIRPLLEKLPLTHVMRLEEFFLSGRRSDERMFLSNIQNELPYETILSMADRYEGLELYDEALQVLRMDIPLTSPMIDYRIAHILHKMGNDLEALKVVDKAEVLSPELMMPHGQLTVDALRWAFSHNAGWPSGYYLALGEWSLGNKDRAKELLDACGNDVPFAPFYMCRAQLETGPEQLADLRRSEAVEKSWRVGMRLINYMNDHGQTDEAYALAKEYTALFPGNYYIGLKYAQALVNEKQYSDCVDYLASLNVLPNEGAIFGRYIYRDACLLQAIEMVKAADYETALKWVDKSEEWPENLGVGKPYDQDIDPRAENYIKGYCYEQMGDQSKARERYTAVTSDRISPNILLSALALKKMGQADKGLQQVQEYRSQFPSPMADYAYHTYTGDRAKAAAAAAGMRSMTEKAAWEDQRNNPYDLKVVTAIIDNLSAPATARPQ